MARFTWGSIQENLDPWGIRKRVAAMTVVEADRYEIQGTFVTFIKDEQNVLSIPERKAQLISVLDENDLPAFDFIEANQ